VQSFLRAPEGIRPRSDAQKALYLSAIGLLRAHTHLQSRCSRVGYVKETIACIGTTKQLSEEDFRCELIGHRPCPASKPLPSEEAQEELPGGGKRR